VESFIEKEDEEVVGHIEAMKLMEDTMTVKILFYLCNDHNVLITYVRISKNRIFILNLNIYKSNCFKAIVGDESTIWNLFNIIDVCLKKENVLKNFGEM
jgi:hypothetical protein